MGQLVTIDTRHRALALRQDGERSLVHRLALALVALTVGSGAVVFNEPAPVDVLTMLLVIGLPVIGLVSIRPTLLVFLSAWLILAGSALFANSFASELGEANVHTAISLYLYLSAFTFAAFVARNPAAHMRLILNAYAAAAVIGAAAGLAGYFGLMPGAEELFTKFGRVSGPFKDPNVFGAFLVLAVVYVLHLALSLRGWASLAAFAALGHLMFAVLLSFSRGAWAATAAGVLIYGYLTFLTAKRNIERARLLGLALAGLVAAVLLVGAATQVDSIADLLAERAALTQTYDEGPEGRFGGQAKAWGLILENPFGIGAHEFTSRHHHEEAHNVYLTIFLLTGWLGGLLYLLIVSMTALLGFRHAFRRTVTQPQYIVAYAALAGIIIEGIIVDTDHWRHFYLLMGLVWGLMVSDRRIVRPARHMADRRPILLRPVIVIPPSRREARRLVPVRPALPQPGRYPSPRRPARIICNYR
jgi:O-antigen ligase